MDHLLPFLCDNLAKAVYHAIVVNAACGTPLALELYASLDLQFMKLREHALLHELIELVQCLQHLGKRLKRGYQFQREHTDSLAHIDSPRGYKHSNSVTPLILDH